MTSTYISFDESSVNIFFPPIFHRVNESVGLVTQSSLSLNHSVTEIFFRCVGLNCE